MSRPKTQSVLQSPRTFKSVVWYQSPSGSPYRYLCAEVWHTSHRRGTADLPLTHTMLFGNDRFGIGS